MRKIEDAVRELGGVWPGYDVDAVYLYKIDNRYIAGLPGGTALHICTRAEFFECARRLRNEPSWGDAPDWAVAKAQDSDGEWYWYKQVPCHGAKYWRIDGESKSQLVCEAEVIGDWRDTLRLRPEGEKVENKNDCGELPPVGTVCRLRFATITDAVVTITYIGDGVLCYRDEQGMEYSATSRYVELLPLQTERERWVDAASKAAVGSLNHAEFLGRLYDTGLAKMPEDE